MTVRLPPRPALIDSNMLIGYFHPRDQHHALATFTIENLDWDWIVVQAVLTEAWGVLNKRAANFAYDMLQQVVSPGRFHFLEWEPFDIPTCGNIVLTHRVDVADAMVTSIARKLTEFAHSRRVPIFTFDVQDFTRIVRNGIVFDVQNQEELVL